MASMPCTPQRTPPSASNPDISATQSPSLPAAPPKNQVEGEENNGVFQGGEKKPDFADGLDDLDSPQCTERFKKYDADYTRRLIAKYFSGKALFGDNIFDEQMTIDDEIIKSSRMPCFQSYADPIVGYEDQCSNGSTSVAETPANIANGKHTMKKNG